MYGLIVFLGGGFVLVGTLIKCLQKNKYANTGNTNIFTQDLEQPLVVNDDYSRFEPTNYFNK